MLMALGLMAAKKDRDWKTGKLTDSRTVDTGVAARRSGLLVGPAAPAAPTTAVVTLTTAELTIAGAEYIYVVRDTGTGVLLTRRLCRYVVGDDVKYVQDGTLMHLIDADKNECKGQIMRQERVPPAAK